MEDPQTVGRGLGAGMVELTQGGCATLLCCHPVPYFCPPYCSLLWENVWPCRREGQTPGGGAGYLTPGAFTHCPHSTYHSIVPGLHLYTTCHTPPSIYRARPTFKHTYTPYLPRSPGHTSPAPPHTPFPQGLWLSVCPLPFQPPPCPSGTPFLGFCITFPHCIPLDHQLRCYLPFPITWLLCRGLQTVIPYLVYQHTIPQVCLVSFSQSIPCLSFRSYVVGLHWELFVEGIAAGRTEFHQKSQASA